MPALKLLTLAAFLVSLALPALAEQPVYLDDRSTPEAVVSSFYNAISRQEYARAWSYYEDGQGVPKFAAFVSGYKSTASAKVTFGQSAPEGAAGSTYWTLPVSLDAVDNAGKHSYFSGCYTLRLSNPSIQAEPPFRPLHIVDGHLKIAKAAGKSFAPADCAP
ncbi:MAG: hypothetical protein ABI398_09625 [Devosia sp.]